MTYFSPFYLNFNVSDKLMVPSIVVLSGIPANSTKSGISKSKEIALGPMGYRSTFPSNSSVKSLF
jgi:hypothetical protein